MLSWLVCLLVIGAEIEVVVGGVLACGVHELGILLEAHHGRWPALPVGRRLHADERKGPDLLEGRALTELQRLIQVGWSIIPVEPIDANICLGVPSMTVALAPLTTRNGTPSMIGVQIAEGRSNIVPPHCSIFCSSSLRVHAPIRPIVRVVVAINVMARLRMFFTRGIRSRRLRSTSRNRPRRS